MTRLLKESDVIAAIEHSTPPSMHRILSDQIRALPSAEHWQSIEGAPTDGRIVLLYCKEPVDRLWASPAVAGNYAIGFCGDNGSVVTHSDAWNTIESREEICGYGSELTGPMSECATIPCIPTHWMPLPAPPKGE